MSKIDFRLRTAETREVWRLMIVYVFKDLAPIRGIGNLEEKCVRVCIFASSSRKYIIHSEFTVCVCLCLHRVLS